MVGWHHWLNGYEFKQTPGDGETQGSLVCCGSWGHKDLATEQTQIFGLPWWLSGKKQTNKQKNKQKNTHSLAKAENVVWSQSWEDPLEKEIATQTNILAWEIPWTEEPGRLQSMGKQKSQTQPSD